MIPDSDLIDFLAKGCLPERVRLRQERGSYLMGQTEEIRMMSRPNRFTYTPITRGHKPTASQESNTLSTMSEVG